MFEMQVVGSNTGRAVLTQRIVTLVFGNLEHAFLGLAGRL